MGQHKKTLSPEGAALSGSRLFVAMIKKTRKYTIIVIVVVVL
jgi:hypothetical protein